MPVDLSEYVDVAERKRQFNERYPEGCLQSIISFVEGGVLCKAFAYRTPDDVRPGIGHAFEPIPGKTPYTRDSETMNAETSAWGRAIVALGFETKKIASADEVRARSGGEDRAAPSGTVGDPLLEPSPGLPAEEAIHAAHAAYLDRVRRAQQHNALPSEQVIHFGKNKGAVLGELTTRQLQWYAHEWKLQEEPSEYDHRLKEAAVALMAGSDTFPDDLPFT